MRIPTSAVVAAIALGTAGQVAAQGEITTGPPTFGENVTTGAPTFGDARPTGAWNEPFSLENRPGLDAEGFYLDSDGERLTDAAGRPLSDETVDYYERSPSGALLRDSTGRPVLRSDAPDFRISDAGDVVVD